MAANDLVVVSVYHQAFEANLAKLRLESEGIACCLDDENLVSTYWLYVNAVGGIKLRVAAADVERAREVLQSRATLPDEAIATEGESAEDLLDADVQCPACGSDDVNTQDRWRRGVVLTLLLLMGPFAVIFVHPVAGAAVLLIWAYWVFLHPCHSECRDCGQSWSSSERRGFPVDAVKQVEE